MEWLQDPKRTRDGVYEIEPSSPISPGYHPPKTNNAHAQTGDLGCAMGFGRTIKVVFQTGVVVGAWGATQNQPSLITSRYLDEILSGPSWYPLIKGTGSLETKSGAHWMASTPLSLESKQTTSENKETSSLQSSALPSLAFGFPLTPKGTAFSATLLVKSEASCRIQKLLLEKTSRGLRWKGGDTWVGG